MDLPRAESCLEIARIKRAGRPAEALEHHPDRRGRRVAVGEAVGLDSMLLVRWLQPDKPQSPRGELLLKHKAAVGGEGYFAPSMQGGFGTRSGPSRGDPFRSGLRPIEASKAAVG
jgi:hypothetical protein